MAYFLGTSIPEKKKITVALTQICGIGKQNSIFLCNRLGFTDNIRLLELTRKQRTKLIRYIENSALLITADLKRSLSDFKKRLVDIRAYRGVRSQQGFPTRGQRTHTNSKTAKKLNKI